MNTLPEKFLKYSECTFDSIDETLSQNATKYSRTTAKNAFSQLFDLDLVTVRLSMPEAFELVAWLIDNTLGTDGIFLVKNPFSKLVPSKEVNTLYARESVPQFSKSVPTKGLSPNITAALLPGTFFNFKNHGKVYMVTNAPNASGTGLGTITFTPGVYEDIPADTEIQYGANCHFQVSCKADVQSLTASVSNGRRTPVTIPVREREL